ncbi:MAG: MBL fold metallo-hydrolase, partial [Caulobacteraceae bacterium]
MAAELAESHRGRALAAAAPTWQRAYDYLCDGKDRVFNAESDPLIQPHWLFDDLGVIGDRGTVLYVLKTADGVVLFDTGYASKTPAVLVDGLKTLGIDPKLIKTVLISHGHPDHFGGAAYLQNTVGPNIWAGAADWPAIMASGVRRGGEAVDGGVIEQGGVPVRTFAVPGHTPGSLAFIFPVHDHGRRHMAALMGGLILGLERASPEILNQYIASLGRLRAASQAANVDV